MPGIMYNNTNAENTGWEVTCHYDNSYNNGTGPASFMECVALFVLEKQQGWTYDFKPACPSDIDGRKGGIV